MTLPTRRSMRSAATYRHMPTGGVTRPTPMTTVISTPNTMESMPTSIVFGDCNNNQSGGKVTDLSSLYPVADKAWACRATALSLPWRASAFCWPSTQA